MLVLHGDVAHLEDVLADRRCSRWVQIELCTGHTARGCLSHEASGRVHD